MDRDDVILELDGHEVKFSNPDKVFFSERGHTKFDLLRVQPSRAKKIDADVELPPARSSLG